MTSQREPEGKAAILAIGTELTTGQITNRNAAWIAEQLLPFGVETVLHETVPDDRFWILEALERCAHVAKLVFITGGLGPTTDDFTRDIVADWLQQPLVFDPPSWQTIQERLTRLSIPIAESNRQQCYFPKNSKILPNSQGTAPGFTATYPKTGSRVWVLPGPPAEVSALWESWIAPELPQILPALEPIHLFTWGCIGKSEAELGEITEAALAGSGLQTGYRAHRPFVEIKVWCPIQDIQAKSSWIQKLEEKIRPWLVTQQDEDWAKKLCSHLNSRLNSHPNSVRGTRILDSATSGLLVHRLSPLLKQPQFQVLTQSITIVSEWGQPQDPHLWLQTQLSQADPEFCTLAIAGFTPSGEGQIGMRIAERIESLQFQSHYRRPELTDRRRPEMMEIAFRQWTQWLDTRPSPV
jgi:molybdenum cofactor synthesis domain-containing protein